MKTLSEATSLRLRRQIDARSESRCLAVAPVFFCAQP